MPSNLYYSQFGQDKYYITNYLPNIGRSPKTKGRFLDVGSHNGVTESNTYVLEAQYGWSGVLIEANPVLSKDSAPTRSKSVVHTAVVWSSILDLEFEYPGEKGDGDDRLARIANLPHNQNYFTKDFETKKTYTVRTTTIANLLGPGVHTFDYGSIDIEGSELEALKGIDWCRTSFNYLVVEWGNRYDYLNELIYYMSSTGYVVYRVSKADVDFVPKTKHCKTF